MFLHYWYQLDEQEKSLFFFYINAIPNLRIAVISQKELRRRDITSTFPSVSEEDASASAIQFRISNNALLFTVSQQKSSLTFVWNYYPIILKLLDYQQIQLLICYHYSLKYLYNVCLASKILERLSPGVYVR